MKRLYLLLVVSVALFLPETVFANENVNDSVNAQIELALKYIDGDSVAKDEQKGISILENLAKQGNAKAQFNVGEVYATDSVNMNKAVYWYSEAAKQEYVPALNALYEAYYKGNGVEQNKKVAISYLERAVAKGDAGAQTTLGDCYNRGDGVEKDSAKAVALFRSAAEQGYPIAQFNLGVCYSDGIGVKKDLQQAIYWFTKVAEQGYIDAQICLGVCYATNGTGRDLSKAVYWYTKAAEQGNSDAQLVVGTSYANGDGVKQDLKKAVY